MDLCEFSEDIVIEILLRSQAKDLIIFKTVCKLWYKLISDSKFASAHLHLHRSCSRNKLIILKVRSYSKEDYMSIKIDPKNMTTATSVETINLNNAIVNPSMSLITASCNGLLLLLTSLDDHPLYVCNLVTRRYTPLPCPPNDNLTRRWAFCYDTSVERYKVFGIWDDYVIMLTSGDEEWNSFTIPIPNPSCYLELTSIVYAERELHWLAQSFDENQNGKTVAVMNYYICSLDVKTREFRKIELPTITAESYAIFVTSESERSSLFFTTVFPDHLDLWGLANKGNNQWMKKFSFSLQCLPKKLSRMGTGGGMCIVGTKDDIDGTDDISGKSLKIFLFLHQGDELLYTDLTHCQKLRQIASINKTLWLRSQYLFHVDSLVSWLPTKAKEEHKQNNQASTIHCSQHRDSK